MEGYRFIKYFPQTGEVVKYFMGEKFSHIEKISCHKKAIESDPNLLSMMKGEKWFEVYFHKEFVIKTTHIQLAIICESLSESTLPLEALFAIVHQDHSHSFIWLSNDVQKEYSEFAEKHITV